MRQKDLKAPFSWKTRQPAWVPPVLYVPEYYARHADFGVPTLFKREAPVWIEYCSGNGDWIADRASRFPEFNWIAVEKRFDRVRKIWQKQQLQKLDNLVVVSGEAFPFSQHYVQKNSIAGCFINFPDPWPKGRHAKHRLFQENFTEELERILLPDAKITIATDDRVFVDEIVQQCSCRFESCLDAPCFVTEWPEYGTSYFEQLWKAKGKTIFYLQFAKKTNRSRGI